VEKSFDPAWNHRVVILNYDRLKKFRAEIRQADWDLLIVDEAHFLKNGKSQRTREVLGGIKRNADREIVERVSPIPAKRRLFLSGTPIVNKPKELWPMLQTLDPTGLGSDWYNYAKRYCALWELKDRSGKRIGWKWDGATNLAELQDRLRASFMVRRLKQDVLTSLPAKIRQVISVEPTSVVSKLITTEISSYQEYAEKLKDSTCFASFQTGSTVRKQLGLAKVKFVTEHLKEILNEKDHEKDKVVVFAHHLEVLDQLAGEFPGECVQLDGRTSMDARDQAVRTFQSDPKIKVFFGGLQAAGVGLTLTAASTVLFAEFDWVPGNNFQAEDRCHRIGQKDCVNVQYIVFAGSLDERIASTDICKQEVIDAALDKE
jgi:SWI/SNF-related matrix-associated actin-dependent regulator 1 of chromatin subfamily A